MLDVYALSVFLAAAEVENFSEAARQLNLTQPAVSMQIQSLEKKLDVALFHRNGRTLNLTEHGRALIPLARDIISRMRQLEEEVEAFKGAVQGHLKIGCSTTTGKYLLPLLVARFRQRYPKVQTTIYTYTRAVAQDKLCDGLVDIVVMSAKPGCHQAEYRHFFTDEVVLIVPPDHPWAGRDVIAPGELRNADFILRDQESGTRQELETVLQKVGLDITDLNMVMEIGNSEAIGMAVEAGIGAAFISRTVARRGIALGKTKEVRVAGLSLARKVYMVYSQRHPISRAQTEFWNFVQEEENEAWLQVAA